MNEVLFGAHYILGISESDNAAVALGIEKVFFSCDAAIFGKGFEICDDKCNAGD